jgi:16S rRNA (uracil1498-N3)-methyltransferase
VITERTNADHTRTARLRAIAVGATEQSGRLEVPQVDEPVKLGAMLDGWTGDRRLMFCDEAGDASPAAGVLAAAGGTSWAILIGPEGGFTLAERARIRTIAGVAPVSLGPRILRADTAAMAALTLWQAMLGDWRGT